MSVQSLQREFEAISNMFFFSNYTSYFPFYKLSFATLILLTRTYISGKLPTLTDRDEEA